MIIGAFIENAVIMICWTILAVVFDHWWIALFSLLFVNSIRWKREDKKEDNDESEV